MLSYHVVFAIMAVVTSLGAVYLALTLRGRLLQPEGGAGDVEESGLEGVLGRGELA